MTYQVARLSASLAGGATVKSDALYDAQQLQEQWFVNGALPETAAVALDERFLRALQTWRQRKKVEQRTGKIGALKITFIPVPSSLAGEGFFNPPP